MITLGIHIVYYNMHIQLSQAPINLYIFVLAHNYVFLVLGILFTYNLFVLLSSVLTVNSHRCLS